MKVAVHNIKLWLFVHAALLFFVRPLSTLVAGGSSVTGQMRSDIYLVTWGFVVLCVVVFVFTFRAVAIPELRVVSHPRSLKLHQFLLPFSVWGGLWFYLVQERLREGVLAVLLASSSEYIHGDSVFMLNSVTVMASFFVVATYSLDGSRSVSFLLRWVLVAFGLVAGLATGSKTIALYPLFVIFMYRSMRAGGVSVSFLMVVALVVGPTLLALNSIRHVGLSGLIGGDAAVFEGSTFVALLDRFYGVDVVYAIVEAHLIDGKPYLLGQSLLGILFFFVPRAIWPEKPVVSFGKIVSDEYLPPEFAGLGISAAPTIFGELVANFAVFSVFFVAAFALIFARHLRFVVKKINGGKSQYLAYYLMAFSTLAFAFEVSIVGWVVQLVVLFALTYSFDVLLRFRWRDRSNAPRVGSPGASM
jgi:hypothetical protein